MNFKCRLFVTACCLSFLFLVGCFETEPYKDPSKDIDERVEDLLKRMSVEQKLLLLQGDGMSTVGIQSLGIPPLNCSDGPFGAHRGAAITSFPCGNSLGASWDTALIADVSAAIGREAKAKDIQCLLGPGINIIRHPLCGRNFEYYSEDPFLSACLGVSFTKGLQGEKVAATLKHYAVNNQEFYRNSLDVIVDERTLQEIYLPAFRDAVILGDAWSVMSAYNMVNGVHCSENKHLLTEILKEDWGFRGFVMPDWAGAHSTLASANNGLDCVVYDSDLFGRPLADAFSRGEISETQITGMARRVLRVIFLTGLMDPLPAADENIINCPEHRKLNRKAAAEGIVLLKNENNVLPFSPEKVKSLAVIGPNAAKLRMGGGGSSYNSKVFYQISPLDGIVSAAGNKIKVSFAQGVGLADTLVPVGAEFLRPSNKSRGTKGLWAEYYNNKDLQGKPIVSQLDTTIDFVWETGPKIYLSDSEKNRIDTLSEKSELIGADNFSVRWTGTITPPKTGFYDFVTHSDDGVRLYVNGEILIDQWYSHDKEFRYGTIELEEGIAYSVKLEYYEEIGGATMRLGWFYHDPEKIEEAVRLAKISDAVVICAGIDKFWEAEGADRSSFDLPLVQNRLIEEVAKVNSNVVVVLNNGGPLNLRPWIEEVPGLVEAWFNGNEGGNAVADILFGVHNPSGKLPFSYVQSAVEFPPAFDNYLNRDKTAEYKEGVFVGYRYHDKYETGIMFPFGFGLSYTTFEYSGMKIEKVSENQIAIHFNVKNTGDFDGAEIAQLYVGELNPTVERPIKELKGFEKIFIPKNESRSFMISVDPRQFSFFDPQENQWKLNKGRYLVQIGSSSVDMKMQAEIEL